jgi:hypothetical protein
MLYYIALTTPELQFLSGESGERDDLALASKVRSSDLSAVARKVSYQDKSVSFGELFATS